MPNGDGVLERPFTAFNFRVVFTREGESDPLCHGAFAECDGLEVTMEPKTYREGGNNVSQIHLVGPVSYGQLSLKRGMTSSFDLWTWYDDVLTRADHGLRLDGIVVMLGSQRAPEEEGGDEVEQATFFLSRCLPVRIKAPALSAKDGQIAIEELTVAYERLKILKLRA
jgi:phage tail-like protein